MQYLRIERAHWKSSKEIIRAAVHIRDRGVSGPSDPGGGLQHIVVAV
jgi:hypothetical protein